MTEHIFNLKHILTERFLRYVQTYSESSVSLADSLVMPSTPQQRDMAGILLNELKSLGLSDVQTTEFCYTYGRLPSNCASTDSVCLIAHIDTSEEVSGKNVRPAVHENYSGGIIELCGGVCLDPETDASLAAAAENRETVITSDGSTLLGADDKAGIAEIMSCLSYFKAHPEVKRRPIEVLFSPDEETGHGMDKVPLALLQSKCAYTVDGGHIGELETECFNAFRSDITFTGTACHTGTARGVMVNAIGMACQFVSSLPFSERPETTDGRHGFYAPVSIEGSVEEARLSLLLRDFSAEGIERRKSVVELLAESAAKSFGGKAECVHVRQYINMKEEMDRHPDVTERLVKAYRDSGIEPVFMPIRGGTDGSRLTEMGIPCPNIFTGGHNFHSRTEWVSLNQMEKAAEVLVSLCTEEQPE